MVLAIISTIVLGIWATVRIVKEVQFDMNCTQYIIMNSNTKFNHNTYYEKDFFNEKSRIISGRKVFKRR